MNLNRGLAKSALNTQFAMMMADGSTPNAIIKNAQPDGSLQIPSLWML